MKRPRPSPASALPKVVIGGAPSQPSVAVAAGRATPPPPPARRARAAATVGAPTEGDGGDHADGDTLAGTQADTPEAKRASSMPPGVVVDDDRAPASEAAAEPVVFAAAADAHTAAAPAPEPETSAASNAKPPATAAEPEAAAAPTRSKALASWAIVDHIAFGEEAMAAGDLDEALKRFKRGLSRLGTKVTPERGAIYVRIGEIMRAKGKTRVAISNFDKALGILADDTRAMNGLIELNAQQGNWRAVLAAEERYLARAASTEDNDARVTFLLASAARWHGPAEHPRRAKERLRAAQQLAPQDTRVLRQLLTIAEAEQALQTVVDLRSQLADQVDDPRDKAKLFYELGEYCLFEVDDERTAMGAFEKALDADPTMLEALEVLASALAEGQEWGELERIYKKMIERHRERDDETSHFVVAELHHRLALLYRDNFDDPESVIKHLLAETSLRPDHLPPHIMLAEVATTLTNYELAREHLERALKLEPKRADTLHRIFGLARLSDDVDRAFLVAATTDALSLADDRERILFREMRRDGVPMHRRALRPQAWAWLRDKQRDRTVEAVMAAIAPAVLRTRVSQLETAGKLPVLSPEALQDPATSTLSAVRSLSWGAKFLGVPTPEIFLDDAADGVLLAPFAKRQSTVIARGALSGRTLPELAFLVGRHLTLRLAEHELVAHIQSVDELRVCFLAAVKIVLGQVPASGPLATAAETLAQLLVEQQPTGERAALEQAVRAFSEAGGRVDLSRWVASVERCARRAGLLLCGDLDVALRLVRGAGDTAMVSAQQSVDDLCVFMASREHLLLRQETGCSSEDAERPALPTTP